MLNATANERKAREPLVLVPQYFGSTVCNRRTSKYLPFDQQATALLRRLAYEPFDILIETVAQADREAVESFFESFYDRGFFTPQLRFAGTVLDVDPPRDHLTGPLAVHLEIVAACNLKCVHCFAGDLPRQETPLTLAELDTLFGTMARMGSFRLGLTGGEPLLRRDLFDVIDLATSYGLHPCLTTNGLLITEEIAREFGKRELVWLNVSLEGATASTNDVVRGSGTFDRVLDKLSLLSKHARFTLAFTIMKTNSTEVRECAELARRVGAYTAVFRPMYPVGVGGRHMELMPTFEEYSDALMALADQHGPLPYALSSIDPFSPLTRSESQAGTYSNGGCGAGNLVCSISVSGDVNPCSFLGPEYAAVNIRETPFDEIWHNSSPFREMRSTTPGGFDGGCRARSLAFVGSPHARDPWIDGHIASDKKYFHPLTVLEVYA